MNTVNHLIQFSELEFSSNIGISFFILSTMILVGMMLAKNTTKTKNTCRQIILNKILSKPITFMRLVFESQCATETVEKYVKLLVDDCSINEKKGKFRILYSPEVNLKEIQLKLSNLKESKARTEATVEGIDNRKKDLMYSVKNELNIEGT